MRFIGTIVAILTIRKKDPLSWSIVHVYLESFIIGFHILRSSGNGAGLLHSFIDTMRINPWVEKHILGSGIPPGRCSR